MRMKVTTMKKQMSGKLNLMVSMKMMMKVTMKVKQIAVRLNLMVSMNLTATVMRMEVMQMKIT